MGAGDNFKYDWNTCLINGIPRRDGCDCPYCYFVKDKVAIGYSWGETVPGGAPIPSGMVSYLDKRVGPNYRITAPPGCLFESGYYPYSGHKQPTATVKQSCKTGFNCSRCNFKNDYAAANRPDGTYLCFNCR